MKRLILTGLASLALVPLAASGTDSAFVNNLVRVYPPGVPPQIDATNFINNSAFIDNTVNSLFIAPYATANTVNYTNFGVLGALEGFRFDTFDTHTQTPYYTNAANLHNEVGAVINCGGTNNGPYFATNFAFYSSAPEALCLASATNIVNRGTIEMGPDSVLSLHGENVSLSGGLVNMEGFETGDFFGTAGTFDGYWGFGSSAAYSPASYYGPFFALAPDHWVTNRYYSDYQSFLSLPLANGYLDPAFARGPSNNWWQVVFLQNSEPSMSNNVYFAGASVVEWVWPSTNIITGIAQTNYLRLYDGLMSYTNLALITNGLAPANTGYRYTYIPTNYSFFRSASPFFSTPANPGLPFGIFGPTDDIQTEYTAYEAVFLPTTVIVPELAPRTYSNMPGRIEIAADKQLDLRSSRISGLNYLRLTATNHFVQDPNTRILTAVADYNLGVTNSTLTVSNLLAPTCPRLNGFVDLFSTRWTNVNAGITNTYHVLMVDSHLASSSPSALQNLTLHATNVVISDVLNVLSNITIDAYSLTITTNGPNAQTPVGELNFPPGLALGAGNLPRLRTLTNYGVISVQNAADFGSSAQPYWHFMNYGSVLAQGCSIWSTNFVNTGLIDAGPGGINLSATSAVLSNGMLTASFNIILNAGSLLVSNHVLNAGKGLVIWATNSLNDGGPDSASYWMSGVLGFKLPSLPPIASLLGTTITGTAPAWASVASQWAGQDHGVTPAGFSNNAALGRLILDGGLNSSFVLQAPAGTNALYVDYLELRNYMTNFDSSGNLANLYFGPGMKIYYAQAIINGVSFAEKLNGKNGGGLNWVSDYAGAFSSTNMVYPDGTTNRLNLALVQSCNLDSDGDGIANCQDLTPVLVPSQIGLTVALTNTPQRAVALFWNSIPYATNSVLYAPSVTAPNWQVLTNFVLGPVGGRQRFVDPVGAGGRIYRVRVDAAGP